MLFDLKEDSCDEPGCPSCDYLKEHGFFVMTISFGVFLVTAPFKDGVFIGKIAGPNADEVHSQMREIEASELMPEAPPKEEMH